MPNAESVDERLSREGSIRRVVLLAMDDDELSAQFAYKLTACGFDVDVTQVAAARRETANNRPDIIVAALSTETGIGRLSARSLLSDPRLRGVPVVAVAADASAATRDLARREGCAAVCLATCTGGELAAGLRAMLERADSLNPTSTGALRGSLRE